MNSKQQQRSSEKQGPGSRFADSWRSRRSKPTSDDDRLDVTAEVDRCGGVVDLVRQDGQLVVKVGDTPMNDDAVTTMRMIIDVSEPNFGSRRVTALARFTLALTRRMEDYLRGDIICNL